MKKIFTLLICLSWSNFSLSMVTIKNIRPASEKTKLLVQKAAQEMEIPFPVTVHAATVDNADGAHRDYEAAIIVNEDELTSCGDDDSLVSTCYHELGACQR